MSLTLSAIFSPGTFFFGEGMRGAGAKDLANSLAAESVGFGSVLALGLGGWGFWGGLVVKCGCDEHF
tara:strand:- start:1281 stop:1481 length:201 start_codon:yes stop_codon:yes gene_type:complete